MSNSRSVTIDLTTAKALVLIDFLARFNKLEGFAFEDQSEQRVLWDLEAILEKQLVEPFRPDYKKLLEQARAEVRDES